MASRVGHYLLFDTLGTGTFAKYVGPCLVERCGAPYLVVRLCCRCCGCIVSLSWVKGHMVCPVSTEVCLLTFRAALSSCLRFL